MGKSNALNYIIIILSLVLSLTGVVIFGVAQSESNLEAHTVVEIDGETSKTLKAEIEGFYPGKTAEYEIVLAGDASDGYSVTLDFHGDNGGELKKYILVEIATENGSVEKTLQELLDGDALSLGQGVSKVKISYTMPIDTGDEAQGASIVFYVDLNAKNLEQ